MCQKHFASFMRCNFDKLLTDWQYYLAVYISVCSEDKLAIMRHEISAFKIKCAIHTSVCQPLNSSQFLA